MPVSTDIDLTVGLVRRYANDQMPGIEGLRQVHRILPMVPIATRKYTVEQILDVWVIDDGAGLIRPDGAPPAQVDWSQSSASGTAMEYACQVRIADRAVEEAREQGDPEKWIRRAVKFIKRKLLMAKNADANTLLSTAANWGAETTDVSAGNQWSNTTNGTPLTDIRLEVANWAERRDLPRLNLIAAGRPLVLHNILNHPETKSDFGGGFAGATTYGSLQQLADKLGIRAVVEIGGVKNSANPGQTSTLVSMYDKDFWLLGTPPGSETSGLMPLDGEDGSYGASFVLDPRLMADVAEGAIDNVDDDLIAYEVIPRDSDYGKLHGARTIIGKTVWKNQILNSSAGHQFADAIA